MACRKIKMVELQVSIDDDCEPSGRRVIYSTHIEFDAVPALNEQDRDFCLREAGWDETSRYEPTLYLRKV